VAEAVYILCAATSALCAFLLLRAYRAARLNLLFWSGLCFVGLAVNNLLMVVDLLVVPDIDLSLWRSGTALGSIAILLFGLVWERQ
jgi:hypothetical protein